MTSPAPLSEAETAAALALSNYFNSVHAQGVNMLGPEEFAGEARAVVAAVQKPIAAEALIDAAERVLDQADRVRVKFGSVHPSGWNRTYGLSEAASMLRADAQSLSLPASKETPDGR